MKTLIAPLLALSLVATAGCHATRSTPEALVRQIGAQRLGNDALATDARHFNATRKRSGDIPAEFWADSIRSLNPHRVYLHRYNVVIVLQASGQSEEGLYVTSPISSFAPVGEADGFKFDHIEGNVSKYTRTQTAGQPVATP